MMKMVLLSGSIVHLIDKSKLCAQRTDMKTLYLIGGTMGVDKTTVSQQLKRDLPNSVFLSYKTV